MKRWMKIAMPLAIAAVLVSVLAIGLGSPSSLAAPGGNGKHKSGGSAGITVPDGNYMGITVATVNPGGESVWIKVECYQDGALVFAGYWRPDSNNQAVIGLGPSQLWTGGDANCTAEEGYFHRGGRWRVIASTTFNAYD